MSDQDWTGSWAPMPPDVETCEILGMDLYEEDWRTGLVTQSSTGFDGWTRWSVRSMRPWWRRPLFGLRGPGRR